MRITASIAIVFGIIILLTSDIYAAGVLSVLYGLAVLLHESAPDPEWTVGGARTDYVLQGYDEEIWKDLEIETEGSLIRTAYPVYNHARARKDRLKTGMREPLRIVKRTTIEEIIEEEEVPA